jgi:hypothetical protein
MAQKPRIYYTDTHKALMWEQLKRWPLGWEQMRVSRS